MFGVKKDLAIHFIGIGGIGMSGIAGVLVDLGYNVSGSDLSQSANVIKLEGKGVKVYIGHKKENVEKAQLIIYSSAIESTNPEVIKAKEMGIPIIKRAEMLAELMRLKFGIAVAGSHGKTTTTSFLSTIFKTMDLKPTCIVGGIVKNLGGHAVHGESEYLIAEADESDGSFLFLNPIMSIITNIDNDHMDFYKNEENIQVAFTEFANKIPFYGCLVLNMNDPNSVKLTSNLRRIHIGFGVQRKDELFDYTATAISYSEEGSEFTVIHEDKSYKVSISLSGEHNVQNALAAIALSSEAGLDLGEVTKAISKFEGVSRRFESLYHSENMCVIDDYGHHPTELLATISTAKVRFPKKKIIAIFEPHRFTRTKEFWDEFVSCFEDVKSVIIAPIYAASESDIEGINSDNLVKDINSKYSNASLLSDWDMLQDIFKQNKDEKIVILSMGAGSISKATREQVDMWNKS